MRAAGTPTIIAVDSTGIAKRVWVGRLPSDVEADLLKLVPTPGALGSLGPGARGERGLPNYASAEDLKELGINGRVQLIDVHERGDQAPRAGVIVMPLMEVSTRSRFELDESGLQVVDCSNVSDAVCDTAVARLSGLGFQVATMGAGSFYESCDVVRVSVEEANPSRANDGK
jgi:hypothetical protein